MAHPTPQIKSKRLANALGLKTELILKREDMHPYGSHKGRSIPLMIDKYRKNGWRDFCVSSSGNAALAAAFYIKELNVKYKNDFTLKIFVGEHIDKNKLKLLEKMAGRDELISIQQVANPKQAAFKLDKEGDAKNLRQSTDDFALAGYEKLAQELGKIKNLSAIFIPTSSGTTAQGIYEGFDVSPQIHIVQTRACHPIVDEILLTKNTRGRVGITAPPCPLKFSSIASAIVDKTAFRKEEVAKAVRESGGNGWIASDEEIKEIIKLVKKNTKISVSPNSALSVVGLRKAIQNNWTFDGPVVCLITGK